MVLKDYYEVRGQGDVIVFIHGSYATTATWRKMVDDLSQDYTCVMFKLPGHCGLPDPPDFQCPTIETELQLLEQIIKKVSSKPIHLVGHSYGGVVALALALKGSVQLQQLTLFEPVATWVLDLTSKKDLTAVVQKFLIDYRQAIDQNQPEAAGRVIDFWCNSPQFHKFPEEVRSHLSKLLQNNVRHWSICTNEHHTLEDLRQLAVPTHLVVGTESVSVAHGIVDTLLECLPNAQKHIIKGANHLLVTTHKDACLAAM